MKEASTGSTITDFSVIVSPSLEVVLFLFFSLGAIKQLFLYLVFIFSFIIFTHFQIYACT